MANMVISTICNQNCAYCFTADHVAQSRVGSLPSVLSQAEGLRYSAGPQDGPAAGRGFLELDHFDERLGFLARSGADEVRLLGGEPTLHPQFVELVDRSRAKGEDAKGAKGEDAKARRIVIFSNGLMPESALACLEAIPVQACTVVVNVNEPAETSGKPEACPTYRRQLDTLRRLGKRAMLGFTIYRTDFQPEFLLDLIAASDCTPTIRLGMAHPCLSGANRYLHPSQYRAVAVKITRFAQLAAEAGATVGFDCGFVRCVFSDADLETLQKAQADVGWRCGPILDVDVEGNVIYCYPLARLVRLPLTPTADESGLRSALEARARPYRQAGVFPECSACTFKLAGECPGGCLAMTIRRFRRTPFRLAIPAEWERDPNISGLTSGVSSRNSGCRRTAEWERVA